MRAWKQNPAWWLSFFRVISASHRGLALNRRSRFAGGMPEPAVNLYLVGFMGTGKTTVGRAVAMRLGFQAMDSDHEIERAQGRTVAQIFAGEGEAAFRALPTKIPGITRFEWGTNISPENKNNGLTHCFMERWYQFRHREARSVAGKLGVAVGVAGGDAAPGFSSSWAGLVGFVRP